MKKKTIKVQLECFFLNAALLSRKILVMDKYWIRTLCQ